MSMKDAIERLEREVEYEKARTAAAEKREGELIEALKQSHRREEDLEQNLKRKNTVIMQLKDSLNSCSAAAHEREEKLKKEMRDLRKDVTRLQQALQAQDGGKASVLREALIKAAEVFEGYACYHFLKGANEKAAANRAHAKMCRDALETDEK